MKSPLHTTQQLNLAVRILGLKVGVGVLGFVMIAGFAVSSNPVQAVSMQGSAAQAEDKAQGDAEDADDSSRTGTSSDEAESAEASSSRRQRNAKLWKTLSPEDRARYRSLHRRLSELDPAKRQEFLARFRNLSAEDRARLTQRLDRFSRASRSDRAKFRRRHHGLRRWARFLPEETLKQLHSLPKEERLQRIRQGFNALKKEHLESLTQEEREAFAQLDRRERGKNLEAFLSERYPERKLRRSHMRGPYGHRHRRGPRPDSSPSTEPHGRPGKPPHPRSELRQLKGLLRGLPAPQIQQILKDPTQAQGLEGFTPELIKVLQEIPEESRSRLLERRGKPDRRRGPPRRR